MSSHWTVQIRLSQSRTVLYIARIHVVGNVSWKKREVKKV